MLPFLLIATSSAQTCLDVVLNSDVHKTLASLATPPVVDTLKSAGRLTLFAPTDAAFDNLKAANPEIFNWLLEGARGERILTYHVIPGLAFDPAKADKKTFAKTANGGVLSATVDGSSVTLAFGFGTSKVTNSIKCSNGIVHVVDSVLVPPTTVDATLDAGKLTKFRAALGLSLNGYPGSTIFAPTDKAFEDLADFASKNKLALTDVLVSLISKLHVVPGVFYSTKIPSVKTKVALYPWAQNQNVSVQAADGKVLVAGEGQDKPANVVIADLLFDSGVIHVIDQVLLPELPDLKKPSPPTDKDNVTEKPILYNSNVTEKLILYNSNVVPNMGSNPTDKDYVPEKPATEKPILSSGVGLGMACSMLIALLQ